MAATEMIHWLRVVAVAVSAAVAIVLVAALASDLAALCYNVAEAWRSDGFTKAVAMFKSGVAIDAVQSLVTIAAIAVGGLFAYYNRGLFRRTEPHLTIFQEVSHRRINDEYLQVGITVILRNTSNVKVEIHDAFCRLSQIAPLASDYVTATMLDPEPTWPILQEIRNEARSPFTIVEPGESSQVAYQFVVLPAAASVLVHTFVYNGRYSEADAGRSQGWQAYTFYDIDG